MSNLINRLRALIGDQDSSCYSWSDDELQGFFDEQVSYQDTLFLSPKPNSGIGGTLLYQVFEAPYGYWEDDITLQNASFTPLTPSNIDNMVGRWKFSTSESGGVYLSGKTYDLYSVAVSVLEAWAVRLKGEFDFAPEAGQSFKRSQQSQTLMAIADSYREKCRPRVISMRRDDIDKNDYSF